MLETLTLNCALEGQVSIWDIDSGLACPLDMMKVHTAWGWHGGEASFAGSPDEVFAWSQMRNEWW